jgi:hypothetical protein
MNATIFQPIAARPAPVNTEGPVAWVKANLLGDWKTTLSTLVIGAILLWYVPQILNWALFSAMWFPRLRRLPRRWRWCLLGCDCRKVPTDSFLAATRLTSNGARLSPRCC